MACSELGICDWAGGLVRRSGKVLIKSDSLACFTTYRTTTAMAKACSGFTTSQAVVPDNRVAEQTVFQHLTGADVVYDQIALLVARLFARNQADVGDAPA